MDPTSPLPEGTVTFLFTDIEGSTRLLQQQGDRYPDLLLEHRRLLRAAVRAWGGHEVLTEGDSFFVTFARAPEALAAAVAAQRALTAHPWPDGAPLRVRMGLHTGEATRGEGGYIGLDVHRAARISAAGHGGQILLSQRTRDLVAGGLPAGVTLQDLGGHRLKDLLQPEHLFQAVIDGLSQEFPPLRSLEAHPNNLPLQVSSFIGREQDLADVKRLLSRRPTGGGYPTSAGEVPARLVTLTGAGGCGKTRLGLQVAADLLEEFADGVWLVELAALAEAALVPQAVASALHLREEPGHTLTETLIDYLQQKELLVVLDNCEHLIGACAELAERLVRQCPRVALLATSREALGIPGEVALRVPSLPVPDPERLDASEADRLAAVRQYAGVRLFLDRAFVHHPGLTVASADAPVLAQVCQRLDGIPLAIELAAARVKVLSLEQIAARLDDRFRLLTGGSRTALPRQQTLRALIDWSYDLLTEAERLLLRRLSVFAGGWTLAAAEAVCAADEIEAWDVLDLLSRLVDKSLVLVEEGAGREARYRLLETIRQYGAQHLRTASEETALRDRHRDWCLELAERAKPELAGPRQAEWLESLEREHDNLRAALSWSAERGEAAPGPGPAHEADRGLRLAGALHQFWTVRGYPGEGRERLAGLLALPGAAARTAARAQALNAAGTLALQQSDYEAARALCEESLAIRRELDDQRGSAASLLNLGMVARNQGDYAAARALYEESLAIQRALGDLGGIAATLRNLGYVACCQGDYDTARTLLEEGLAILREIGDQRGIALALDGLGNVAYYQEAYERTRALYEESLTIQRALGDKWNTARLLHNIGTVAIRQGDYTAARALYAEGLEIQRKLGDKRGIAYSVAHLGEVATLEGDYPAARALQAESLVIRRQLGDKLGIAYSLEGLALLASAEGQAMRAARSFGAAAALRAAIHAPLGPAERAEYEHHLAATRAALGEEAFAAAWAEGQLMSLEDAVACALGEDLAT